MRGAALELNDKRIAVMLTLGAFFATMLVGCAIALVPIGLVVLGLVVLSIIGAMRCYQRWMLAN